MAGSNTIEFRWAVKKLANGTIIDQRYQFRTRDTIISILGVVSLSVWSEWQDMEVDVQEITVNGA